jgi:hypothetical protein
MVLMERFETIRKLLGISIADACGAMDIGRATFFTLRKEQKTTKRFERALVTFCNYYKISHNWLVSGQRPALIELHCNYLELHNAKNRDEFKKFVLLRIEQSEKGIRRDIKKARVEFDTRWSDFLRKFSDYLGGFFRELRSFQQILRAYFVEGKLSEKEKQKIASFSPRKEIHDLLDIPKKFDIIVWFEAGVGKNPIAPFFPAYEELIEVISHDRKVPNLDLPNRPQLCQICDIIICPTRLRGSSGQCPFCGRQLINFSEFNSFLTL